MKKVFAVAINFNKEEITKQWLDSIQQVVMPKDATLDIVIVDNGSKEPFVLDPKRQKQNVHVILHKENAGFTGGNNIGLQYSLDHGADYLLIINNDTVVDPHLVKNLLTFLESDAKIGMV